VAARLLPPPFRSTTAASQLEVRPGPIPLALYPTRCLLSCLL
jgi:hypothetical protein